MKVESRVIATYFDNIAPTCNPHAVEQGSSDSVDEKE